MRHLIESTQKADAFLNVDPLKTSEISKLLKSKETSQCLFQNFAFSYLVKTTVDVKDGGARRDRTADLLRARQALSQLSYGPHDLSFFRLAALRCSFSRSCTVCTLPPSLSSRLADEKKSCVSVLDEHLKFLTSFFDALSDSFRKSNKDSPFCSDQGGGLRRIAWLCKRADNAELGEMVGLGRFELPTSPLSGVRSNQLSYRPKDSHWPLLVIR